MKPKINSVKAALIKAQREAENERWEKTLAQILRGARLIHFETQYKAIPGREYRFDFAFVNARLLVEVNGGLWTKDSEGRAKGHAHPTAIIRDYEKTNLATLWHWQVLTFAPEHIESGQALIQILQALGIAAL